MTLEQVCLHPWRRAVSKLPLAARLSSPQELRDPVPSRLSLSPIAEEDPYADVRHLPVQTQLDVIFGREKARKAWSRKCAKRALYPTPLVPRRKPLPPPVPQARGVPLPPRITTRIRKPAPSLHVPIRDTQVAYRTGIPASFDFTKRSHAESAAILLPRVTAVIKRLQAIFDRKGLLESLEPHVLLNIQTSADRIEKTADYLHDLSLRCWHPSDFREIEAVTTSIGHIRFKDLKGRFNEVVDRVNRAVLGPDYLAWAV